ncbi:MAG TPA: NUDIX domain-containing protein [Candidatus Paceibacterota bacterium]
MAHIHEKIDWTVEVFVVNDGAVLLRMHDKYKFWLSVGGHIELDEEPTQAALREVKEEVGLDAKLIGEVAQVSEGEGYRELLPPRFMNIHAINETHQHVSLVYFATADSREITENVESEKSDNIRWFTREDLDDPNFGLRETIRHYAYAALDAAGV